ncbi:PGF-CTERM sorting domain-containing protein [Natrononativus amylolyticus]|uniref:PGF-CTERM sorting domain-containing protein n=1 Tax=Natrononativus amylolyticus TaxID=2963434 RepID=UPI0020CC70B2|nr:PGF-CTERM sorting domain-containing protein [Natrononativus amylolyticus]
MFERHEPEVYRAVAGAVVLVLASIAATGFLAGPAAASTLDAPATYASVADQNVTIEDEYVEPVPERGDTYFEAEDPDGNWISYINPRDRYRSPYLGDGSGKICVTLLNEAGEHVVGESVPNTTATVPTGDSLEWHPDADPMVVEFPLTEHYDRPLDADQFGTTSDLPQGDGYLDSHCIEIHGLPEDETVEYGEVEIDGEYADWIEVVGYIQVENEAWDTDVDPIADAVPYEEAGGWTYHPDGSHGQVVIVLQLDPPEDAYPDTTETDDDAEGDDEAGTDDETGADDTESGDGDDEQVRSDDAGADDATGSGADRSPGFGVVLALVALGGGALLRARR